jgi:hypothetical protein
VDLPRSLSSIHTLTDVDVERTYTIQRVQFRLSAPHPAQRGRS